MDRVVVRHDECISGGLSIVEGVGLGKDVAFFAGIGNSNNYSTAFWLRGLVDLESVILDHDLCFHVACWVDAD